MPLNSITLDRFWSKVEITPECWPWQAGRTGAGYGAFWLNGKTALAHRIAYELHHGIIDPKLQIDHLCRNRGCVNPNHMEQVTSRENVRRGIRPRQMGDLQRSKTHCPYGHPYDLFNTYIRKDGRRECRICMKARAKHWI